jgi:two-component sensor histidine kinase
MAGEITDETRNFISMAKRNIQTLQGIIEDLLDLSRIQTGKLDFRYKNINITPSLELLLKNFYQSANKKNINISLDIQNELPEIYADSRRIEQIFTNLVSNSLKFTSDNGKIDITASVVNAEQINKENLVMPKVVPSGDYIKISVIDNGIGIKQEDIPKIFDKFSQIESSLNRNKGGIGLGLTITKQFIDSHLGLIEVISKEQAGSSFTVYLPVLDEFKVFILNLSKALVNNEAGVFKILFKNTQGNLIDILKEQKIINLSKNSKEYLSKKENYSEYYAYIPAVSSASFGAICSIINEYLQKNKENYCDIMFSKIHSSTIGNDANLIINRLEN